MNETHDIHEGLMAATKSYVAETMHAPLELSPWPGVLSVPRFLTNTYLMVQGDLLGRQTLWLLASDEPTPSAVVKHMSAIGEHWPYAQVVVFGKLPSYARQRLIENGVPFVVPGTQLYLPGHGVDFRSRSKKPVEIRSEMRPSSQALLLYLLLHASDPECARTATEFAPMLGQTLMTSSRAVAELEAHGLVLTRKRGRSKEVFLRQDPRETWEASQPLLRNPVMRRLVLLGASSVPGAGYPLAGLSALSQKTMLAEPYTPTYAVSREVARGSDLEVAAVARDSSSMAAEADVSTVEVWAYDPVPLSKDGVVDPLSLCLSLRDDQDERVQGALERMIEGLPW